MITKNSFVSVSYELRTEKDGEIIESANVETPLSFICGQKQTLEVFENNLQNKNKGDEFDFVVKSSDAYGDINDDLIVDLPKNIFDNVDKDDMVVGNTLPMMDSTGRKMMGVIAAIGASEVTIDFNHPLAGKDLFFKGQIIEDRQATDEEIAAIHAHKCGGCSGCGSSENGSCGGCSGSCGN